MPQIGRETNSLEIGGEHITEKRSKGRDGRNQRAGLVLWIRQSPKIPANPKSTLFCLGLTRKASSPIAW
jgi:hypothetical protein